MTIDYKQLRSLVKEAMFTGGGINEPSAPEGIPHRMPAADTDEKEQEMGDPAANKLYDIALVAREATEELVEALDDPAFDKAYEHAFKASACLRKTLNSLEEDGAHPMPHQRVVAPPKFQQKYTGGSAGDYAGGAGNIGVGGYDGVYEQNLNLGARAVTQSAQAAAAKKKGSDIAAGTILQGVSDKERAILNDVENVMTRVADVGDLTKFRSSLQQFLQKIIKDVEAEEKGEA